MGKRTLNVDLGAEKILAAEKQGRKIAVEVKSFLSVSPVHDLEEALGQYIVYEDILELSEPERIVQRIPGLSSVGTRQCRVPTGSSL
ncbi:MULTISPECIES: element excision factor XisH family protein [unclassified Microcoleus]|uniref:element excision factor XisH family protein n=1 Tax=unclassified Microcoleus TaxID=2642155 RepID=UPI00403F052E